jgi:hypothetical protein
MAHNKKPYFIPAGDYLFYAWAKNYQEVCSSMATIWGLPAERLNTMGVRVTAFGQILDRCHGEQRTKADTKSKNMQRKVLQKDCRTFNKEFTQFSSKVTDDDRIRLQIPVNDVKRSNIPVPTTTPLFSLTRGKNPRQIIIRITDPVTGELHIPSGMNGAVAYYKVVAMDAPAPAIEELIQSVIATSSRFTLKGFTSADEGKRVYIALCWENEKGEYGPKGDMQSIILA